MEGNLAYFYTSRTCVYVSHLLYVDDTLIFLNATITSVKRCMDFLKSYCDCSSQWINTDKSSLITFGKFSDGRMESLRLLTRFQSKISCFEYFGVPIIQGRTKVSHFEKMVGKVRRSVSG